MRDRALHPILVAIIPVVFLLQHNRGQPVTREEVMPVIALSLGLGLSSWLAFTLVARKRANAAFAASVATALILSYGHYANAVSEVSRRLGFSQLHARSALLSVPWLIVLVLATWWLVRTRRDLRGANGLVNSMGAGVLAMMLVAGALAPPSAVVDLPAEDVDVRLANATAPDEPPNIYYVVLDAYASPRTLEKAFAFEGEALATGLRDRGFFVPNESHANYARTVLSLPSTLHMEYLDPLPEAVGEDSVNERPAYGLIEENRVAKFLKSQGYEIVHFDSGWVGTEWTPHADEIRRCGTFTEFQRVAAMTTILALMATPLYERDAHDRNACIFKETGDMPRDREPDDPPRFVFAHLVTPHDPYVFGPAGERVDGSRIMAESGGDKEVEKQLYLDQLSFVGERALHMIDRILEAEEREPVIIVQSDHGTNLIGEWDAEDEAFLKARLRNFNALHLPGVNESRLHERATNVNTFRFVLNHYFEADLPILPNKSYFSTPEATYRFQNVTDVVRHPRE